MDILSLVFLGFALAADAFAVSLCKGFGVEKLKLKHYLIVGFYFGGFQGLMPIFGYFLSVSFSELVKSFDHWIAFILLVLIGAKMIQESLKNEACSFNANEFSHKIMLPLAIATSIDALVIGVSFAFLQVNLVLAIFLIFIITFFMCILALVIGNKFGVFLKNKAEFLGGVLLILLAFKILISHLLFD